jgi:hypothetical protein
MSYTKGIDHSETKYVPCSRASAREHGKHPVTISYAEDGQIVGISCPCNRKTDADEALHRLGGDLCYKTVELVRAAIKKMEPYSDEADHVYALFYTFREGIRCIRRMQNKRTDSREVTDVKEAKLTLLERLSSKRCTSVAGFPITVRAFYEQEVAVSDREMRMNGDLVAVRNSVSGQWDLFPEMIKSAAGARMVFINNSTCVVCRKNNVGSIGTAHLGRISHYEAVLFAVQRAVAALRRANTNGRKLLCQT